jgi:phosphoribosylformimino-5-aminoimidazole carboxamide ribonucleotide (ProFAR) isomerase
MEDDQSLPHGGITPRKYAAMCLALGVARGALYSIEKENVEEVRHILDVTATAHIARALDWRESDLTIIWDEHLSYEEIIKIKGA